MHRRQFFFGETNAESLSAPGRDQKIESLEEAVGTTGDPG